jgi:hypothetical protein
MTLIQTSLPLYLTSAIALAGLVSLCLASPMVAAKPVSAPAAATRCGWLDNPTPGNWTLTDRVGEWTISMQGGHEAQGLEDLPDMTTRGWKITNSGNYGYGCACMRVTADVSSKTITEIIAATPKPLRVCRADRRLPKRK